MQKLLYSYLQILIVITLCLITLSVSGQQTNTKFGKNRVQFSDKFEEWSQYESENFIFYWYGKARKIGESAVLIAEHDYAEIKTLLEHRLPSKVEVIVYNDLSDLKQSNIGEEDAFSVVEDRVKVVGNKVFIHYNGNHNELKRQIREGVASVTLSSMMYGESLQEIVQNAVLLDIPLWYSEGLVSFVGEGWGSDNDEYLRSYFLTAKNPNFSDFKKLNPRIAGNSWWNYLIQNYGKSTIGNFLYLTRISRSVESAVEFVYAISFQELNEGWKNYYDASVKTDLENKQTLASIGTSDVKKIKNRHDGRITQWRYSPDGKRAAYVINDIGRQKIYVQDLLTNKRKRVFTVGYRNAIQAPNYDYPLIAWNPNNDELAILYESKDVLRLRRITTQSKTRPIEEPMDPQLESVYGIDYYNSSQLVLSASVKGINDLYRYYLETRQSVRITNDFYDETEVRRAKIDSISGFLFLSNRPDTSLAQRKLDSILPTGAMNLFFLADDRVKYPYVIRLTNSKFHDIAFPAMLDSSNYSFVSNETGVFNLYEGHLEQYIPYYEMVVFYKDGDVRRLPDGWEPSEEIRDEIKKIERRPVYRLRGINRGLTDLSNSIDFFDAKKQNIAIGTQYTNKKINWVNLHVDSMQRRQPSNLRYRNQRFVKQKVRPDLEGILPAWLSGRQLEYDSIAANKIPSSDGTLFQSTFSDPPKDKELQKEVNSTGGQANTKIESQSKVSPHRFRPARIRSYIPKFSTVDYTSTLSNEPLFGGLDNFASSSGNFRQQPTGLLLNLVNKELFENYTLELGTRIATTLDGAEFYGYLDTKATRIDKRYGLYFSTKRRLPEVMQDSVRPRARLRSVIAVHSWKYPFNVFSAVSATATYRLDSDVPQILSAQNLEDKIQRQHRVGLRLEYIFDNSLDYARNIKFGSRAKVYAEVAKGFNFSFSGDEKFSFKKGLLTLVGFDARHYFRVLKHSVFAVRMAGASSFGAEKILFYLGNTDGALTTGYDSSVPVAVNDYAYEMSITNIRGFVSNIRNGNSFALVNAEFRFPLFRYKPIDFNNNFLKNIQLVGFFDAGTAWKGFTPFNRDNPINTIVYDDDPAYKLTVNYFRDPIVYGFGYGIRFNLFGYFLRVDQAYPIETGSLLEPRTHFSLGLDF